MQPQLQVHQLILSYWMDRGLRYRVLSPLQHQYPQEFRQWTCPQLYLSPTPQEASDQPAAVLFQSFFSSLLCFAAFFVSDMYVVHFFRISSTFLACRDELQELTFSQIASHTRFFVLFVVTVESFENKTPLHFSTSLRMI